MISSKFMPMLIMTLVTLIQHTEESLLKYLDFFLFTWSNIDQKIGLTII